MARILFSHTGVEKELKDGSQLEEICREEGLPIVCNEGFCGTCIFEVKEGMENLSPPTEAEINFLGEEGVKKERMACQCKLMKGKVAIQF